MCYDCVQTSQLAHRRATRIVRDPGVPVEAAPRSALRAAGLEGSPRLTLLLPLAGLLLDPCGDALGDALTAYGTTRSFPTTRDARGAPERDALS